MTDVDVGRAGKLVAFLGLAAAVGPTPERALRFRLGPLYPYSDRLRRVYDRYVAVAEGFPDAGPLLVGEAPRGSLLLRRGDEPSDALERYVVAVEDLHGRTAFASHATDTGVKRAGVLVRDAIARVTAAVEGRST